MVKNSETICTPSPKYCQSFFLNYWNNSAFLSFLNLCEATLFKKSAWNSLKIYGGRRCNVNIMGDYCYNYFFNVHIKFLVNFCLTGEFRVVSHNFPSVFSFCWIFPQKLTENSKRQLKFLSVAKDSSIKKIIPWKFTNISFEQQKSILWNK